MAIFGAIANSIFSAVPDGHRDPDVVTQAGTAVFLAVLICTLFTLCAALAMPRARVEDIELKAHAPSVE